MKTQVFIDDGYPESREYSSNYYLIDDPDIGDWMLEFGAVLATLGTLGAQRPQVRWHRRLAGAALRRIRGWRS